MGLPLQSSYWGNYLFLELAKQMGLPFPDICERCPKIVQGQMVLSNNSNKITQLEVLCPSGDRKIFPSRNGDRYEYSDTFIHIP